jgi:hypothetical protein
MLLAFTYFVAIIAGYTVQSSLLHLLLTPDHLVNLALKGEFC